MDIRSLTYFFDPKTSKRLPVEFLKDGRTAFNYPVQSIRLATTPFPEWATAERSVEHIVALAQEWKGAGPDYVSVGPAQLQHEPEWVEQIPTLLSQTDFIFTSAEISDGTGQIDLGRCQQVAQVIIENSQIMANGFGNLYFTALANCRAGSPFFPVAYHEKGNGRFAIAVESADIALDAIRSSKTLVEARQNLIQAIENAAKNITKSAMRLASQYNIPFYGIDFSLAPFPTDDKSLGGALEALGVPHVGAVGSLFASGFITDAIERANFQRCGFSGLMLPVLEDSILAKRVENEALTIQTLLSYSAVCGVGLDTIPLPGDCSLMALTAVLMDTAVLASRLNKPLTARLMPIPQMSAGDAIDFDFPYFAPSRTMAIKGGGVTGLLTDTSRLPFKQIDKNNDSPRINQIINRRYAKNE